MVARTPLSTLGTHAKGAVKALSSRVPALRRPTERAWSEYVHLRMRLNARWNAHRHVQYAPLDPFRLVTVDPARIEYVTESHFPGRKYHHAGGVKSGDWDRLETRFVETPVYRAFEAHFEDGVPWQETAFYDRVVDRIDDGTAMWGCATREAFDRRCDRLDALYETLGSEGYRTQAELTESDADDPIEKGHVSWVQRFVYDEMTVNVGREGDLLFYDGRNRLAIAKLLGLDSVAVWVLVRHTEWQGIREWVAEMQGRREFPGWVRTHPDVRYLFEGEAERSRGGVASSFTPIRERTAASDAVSRRPRQ